MSQDDSFDDPLESDQDGSDSVDDSFEDPPERHRSLFITVTAIILLAVFTGATAMFFR